MRSTGSFFSSILSFHKYTLLLQRYTHTLSSTLPNLAVYPSWFCPVSAQPSAVEPAELGEGDRVFFSCSCFVAVIVVKATVGLRTSLSSNGERTDLLSERRIWYLTGEKGTWRKGKDRRGVGGRERRKDRRKERQMGEEMEWRDGSQPVDLRGRGGRRVDSMIVPEKEHDSSSNRFSSHLSWGDLPVGEDLLTNDRWERGGEGGGTWEAQHMLWTMLTAACGAARPWPKSLKTNALAI